MDTQRLESLPPPPGVIVSLRAGFDAVAGHVGLILAPFALDLFLWLGPRLSVEQLLLPLFRYIFEQARRGVAASEVDRFLEAQTIFLDAVHDYNLFSLVGRLSTFPIGISSLLARKAPTGTPYGIPQGGIEDVSSLTALIGLMLLFALVGWIAGGLYFRQVSGATLGSTVGISVMRAIIQTLIISLMWLIGLTLVSLPAVLILTILALLSPLLANIVIVAILLVSFWFIVPLFFTSHGIFVRKQNALLSILTSMRMVWYTFPTSGMFVISTLILSQGLNYLWRVPPGDSWMMVVGLAGHAFISTALLSASFIYYRDMNVWLQTAYEQWQKTHRAPTQHA